MGVGGLADTALLWGDGDHFCNERSRQKQDRQHRNRHSRGYCRYMTAGTPGHRTRRQEQGEQSREVILEAAARLMAANGFDGASISSISKESGLPASSIYWHFTSKEGVL